MSFFLTCPLGGVASVGSPVVKVKPLRPEIQVMPPMPAAMDCCFNSILRGPQAPGESYLLKVSRSTAPDLGALPRWSRSGPWQ